MKNQTRTPRLGLIVALCAVLGAIWAVALYGTYEEAQREKYDVHITPGAVNYGTHSAAPVLTVTTNSHRDTGVPMISGGVVRQMAHSGHATMPTVSASKGLYTTSSATVHAIGGGGSTGGSGIATTSTSSSSSRGISYGSASVSMPILALATPAYASQTNTQEAASRYGIGPRRVNPNTSGEEGDEGDWFDGEEDGWWYMGEDGVWHEVSLEDTRFDPVLGYTVIWNGSGWVKLSDYEPGSPVGPTPWILMTLLAIAYAVRRKLETKKQNAI